MNINLLDRLRRHVASHEMVGSEKCREANDWRDAINEIERLQALLLPFVTAANDADGYLDNHPIGCDPCMPLEGLTVGDLRRARDAKSI